MTNAALRIGVAGLGHVHVPHYLRTIPHLDGAVLACIYDDDAELAKGLGAEHGLPVAGSLDDLLSAVDAVVVSGHHRGFRRLVVAAAGAGRPVLCEKPLGTGVEEAAEMVSACRSAGVSLSVCLPVRYDPGATELRRLYRSGELGDVLAVAGTNHGPFPGGFFGDPALAGGGALMDHTVHVVDLLRWIWGEEVVAVYAQTATRHHLELAVDDSALILGRLAGGTVFSLDPSWSRPEGMPGGLDLVMEVTGTKANARFDLFFADAYWYGSGGEVRQVRRGADCERMLLDDWLAAVREDREPPITGEDGLAATAVVAAAYESARTGDWVSVAT